MANVLQTLVVKLTGDAADYEKTIKRARASLDSFAGGAQKIGGALTLGVTAPLAAIGTASLGMASDLNETVSKVDTLFGGSAAGIQAWADSAAESFGLSKQAALDGVGTLGNMFMQLGAGNDQAAQLSQGMVGLSADIASFHNVAGGSTEVLGAMTSAFRGEYDALQRYIPTINAAAVEQAALTATGKTTADELTNLDKALAVQSLIMEGAGAAVGDFARTSDGLANSQRILQAQLSDVGAELGQQLLPIALEVANGLSTLVGWFSNLSPETQKWIVVLAGVAAAAGPVIGTIGTIAGGVSSLMGLIAGAGGLTGILGGLGAAFTVLTGPIGLTVAAIAGLALAWNKDFLGIKTATLNTITSIRRDWPGFVDGLKTKWGQFTTWIAPATNTAMSAATGYVRFNFDAMKGILTAGVQIMTGDWSGGLETLRSTGETAWGRINEQFGTQIDTVKRLFTDYDWAAIGSAILQGIANGISSGVETIRQAAQSAAQSALNAAKSWLGIRSPSRVAADEIGKPFAQGIGRGVDDALRNTTGRIQFALDSVVGRLEFAPAAVSAGPATTTYNISVPISGRATYEDGRRMARGIWDELRARGAA